MSKINFPLAYDVQQKIIEIDAPKQNYNEEYQKYMVYILFKKYYGDFPYFNFYMGNFLDMINYHISLFNKNPKLSKDRYLKEYASIIKTDNNGFIFNENDMVFNLLFHKIIFLKPQNNCDYTHEDIIQIYKSVYAFSIKYPVRLQGSIQARTISLSL